MPALHLRVTNQGCGRVVAAWLSRALRAGGLRADQQTWWTSPTRGCGSWAIRLHAFTADQVAPSRRSSSPRGPPASASPRSTPGRERGTASEWSSDPTRAIGWPALMAAQTPGDARGGAIRAVLAGEWTSDPAANRRTSARSASYRRGLPLRARRTTSRGGDANDRACQTAHGRAGRRPGSPRGCLDV